MRLKMMMKSCVPTRMPACSHNEWVVHLIIQDDRCSTRGVERNHGANRGDVAQDAADEEERYGQRF